MADTPWCFWWSVAGTYGWQTAGRAVLKAAPSAGSGGVPPAEWGLWDAPPQQWHFVLRGKQKYKYTHYNVFWNVKKIAAATLFRSTRYPVALHGPQLKNGSVLGSRTETALSATSNHRLLWRTAVQNSGTFVSRSSQYEAPNKAHQGTQVRDQLLGSGTLQLIPNLTPTFLKGRFSI